MPNQGLHQKSKARTNAFKPVTIAPNSEHKLSNEPAFL